jgi:hypothetical protein
MALVTVTNLQYVTDDSWCNAHTKWRMIGNFEVSAKTRGWWWYQFAAEPPALPAVSRVRRKFEIDFAVQDVSKT